MRLVGYFKKKCVLVLVLRRTEIPKEGRNVQYNSQRLLKK